MFLSCYDDNCYGHFKASLAQATKEFLRQIVFLRVMSLIIIVSRSLVSEFVLNIIDKSERQVQEFLLVIKSASTKINFQQQTMMMYRFQRTWNESYSSEKAIGVEEEQSHPELSSRRSPSLHTERKTRVEERRSPGPLCQSNELKTNCQKRQSTLRCMKSEVKERKKKQTDKE